MHRCEGFSGADLQGLLYNAHLSAIHEALDAAAGGTGTGTAAGGTGAAASAAPLEAGQVRARSRGTWGGERRRTGMHSSHPPLPHSRPRPFPPLHPAPRTIHV